MVSLALIPRLSGPDLWDTVSQKLTRRVVTSPKIIVIGGHVLVTDYQAISRVGYKTIKVQQYNNDFGGG